MMQAPSPVDGNVRLLFVQLYSTSCNRLTNRAPFLSHINCKSTSRTKLTSLHLLAEFDVIITVILGHLLSAGFAIVEQQVVCHADSVGLHGIAARLKLARLANVPG
uniref:Uncharacterized protein n=1 Tax=Mastacembelus armatus TaxID=205130 RepID=A0A7N8WSK6_9TELE